jgi:hypothetical protein
MIKIRGGRVQLRIDMNHFEVIIRCKVVFLVIAGLICVSAGCRPRSSEEAPADTEK